MEVMTHIPSFIQSNHALVCYDGHPPTHYTDTIRHRHGEELDECADSAMTCAVMEQQRGEKTQKEQGRIRHALSWDFIQLLTFFSRTNEKEYISKKLNPELGAGRMGRKRG